MAPSSQELEPPGNPGRFNLSPLAAGGFGIVLGKGRADKGRDDAPALLAGMSQDIAHEVNAAALPSRIQDLSDGGLEPLMRIRDDELDAAQTPPGKLAQEVGPKGLGLRGTDRQAQD